MRLSIDGGGYATAATAFADANQVSALQHDSLTGKLGSYAAMAGDDATSADFARAYDDTAGEAVRALSDLVTAFANLGRLTEQSLANHRNANTASIIAGSTVYDGTSLPEVGYVSVLPATVPSSLGGDPPSLSFQENWILDHVEGFVWPNADTARLRDAAHLWRSAAEGLDHLTTYCDAAVRGFESQQSPEIPVAIEATTSLRRTIDDLATQYAALAASCESYALEVDAAHERTRALLREVLAMVVEGVIISVAIGLISAGAGALVGGRLDRRPGRGPVPTVRRHSHGPPRSRRHQHPRHPHRPDQPPRHPVPPRPLPPAARPHGGRPPHGRRHLTLAPGLARVSRTRGRSHPRPGTSEGQTRGAARTGFVSAEPTLRVLDLCRSGRCRARRRRGC